MQRSTEEKKRATGSGKACPPLPRVHITSIINRRRRGHETLINSPALLRGVSAEVTRQITLDFGPWSLDLIPISTQPPIHETDNPAIALVAHLKFEILRSEIPRGTLGNQEEPWGAFERQKQKVRGKAPGEPSGEPWGANKVIKASTRPDKAKQASKKMRKQALLTSLPRVSSLRSMWLNHVPFPFELSQRALITQERQAIAQPLHHAFRFTLHPELNPYLNQGLTYISPESPSKIPGQSSLLQANTGQRAVLNFFQPNTGYGKSRNRGHETLINSPAPLRDVADNVRRPAPLDIRPWSLDYSHVAAEVTRQTALVTLYASLITPPHAIARALRLSPFSSPSAFVVKLQSGNVRNYQETSHLKRQPNQEMSGFVRKYQVINHNRSAVGNYQEMSTHEGWKQGHEFLITFGSSNLAKCSLRKANVGSCRLKKILRSCRLKFFYAGLFNFARPCHSRERHPAWWKRSRCERSARVQRAVPTPDGRSAIMAQKQSNPSNPDGSGRLTGRVSLQNRQCLRGTGRVDGSGGHCH